MAQGDQIRELEKDVAGLKERLENQIWVINSALEGSKELVSKLHEYRRELDALQREIGDFKKWKERQEKSKEEWMRRLWAFGPNLVAALIAGVVALVVAKYFK